MDAPVVVHVDSRDEPHDATRDEKPSVTPWTPKERHQGKAGDDRDGETDNPSDKQIVAEFEIGNSEREPAKDSDDSDPEHDSVDTLDCAKLMQPIFDRSGVVGCNRHG